MFAFLTLILFLDHFQSSYSLEYDDKVENNVTGLTSDMEADSDFEPINPLLNETSGVKDNDAMDNEILNINCEDFTSYDLNCAYKASSVYKSNKKAPPPPEKIDDWCQKLRTFTNCAMDWNADCKMVTDHYYNEESIYGMMHVLENICDNNKYLRSYANVSDCLNNASRAWSDCYTLFKRDVDYQKNRTKEWTHFEIHFFLCCSRASFRRCTLEILNKLPQCSQEQAITLQRFSVIVSQGDVFQDCDFNMMYDKCPGGDPRPTGKMLAKLMNVDVLYSDNSCSRPHVGVLFYLIFSIFVYFLMFY